MSVLARRRPRAYRTPMRDRPAVIILVLLALVAVAVIWLWASDGWLKFQCRQHDGTWDPTARTCLISAGSVRRLQAEN